MASLAHRFSLGLMAVLSVAAASGSFAAQTIRLAELDLSHLHVEGWKKASTDRSFSGKTLLIGGQKFEHGLGTRATTTLWVELDGHASEFIASVGVDDGVGNSAAAVVFSIVGDDRMLWESGVMRRGEPAKPVVVNLKGVRSLLLKVDHAGESQAFNHADWAAARFVIDGAKPVAVAAPREEAVILTRSEEEGRTLLHELFRAVADLEATDIELRVTIAPLSSPHRTLAVQALCATLNEAAVLFPGSLLTMRFAVHPPLQAGMAFPDHAPISPNPTPPAPSRTFHTAATATERRSSSGSD